MTPNQLNDHVHLSKEERQQALVVASVLIKLVHARVLPTVEQSLIDVGEYLRNYGRAGNHFPPQRSGRRDLPSQRESFLTIASQGVDARA
jgi:hypothetical protein